MSVHERLDRRWHTETALAGLAGRSGGRLVTREQSATHVLLEIECRSAFRGCDGRPEVRPARHLVGLYRQPGWPAVGVLAIHRGPPGIWHPNVLVARAGPASPLPAEALQQLAGMLLPGVICYGQATPGTTLTDVVLQLYNLLGYRFGVFSRQGAHLNLAAVQWVNAMLAENASFFPLEPRPLVPR